MSNEEDALAVVDQMIEDLSVEPGRVYGTPNTVDTYARVRNLIRNVVDGVFETPHISRLEDGIQLVWHNKLPGSVKKTCEDFYVLCTFYDREELDDGVLLPQYSFRSFGKSRPEQRETGTIENNTIESIFRSFLERTL